MGAYDSSIDSPFRIKNEGRHIEIRFQKTSPTTARISWNIPAPLNGCSADDLAYNGIVVTLDNNPISVESTPVDAKYYTGDPTANINLHVGDKLGNALVVGATYDDKTTTFFDISGLSDSVPYYVSGFAVDIQGRYHTEGSHAYSLPYGKDDTIVNAVNGFHFYEFNQNADDVIGTDPTGLATGSFYDVSFVVNRDGTARTTTINGFNAQTYSDLITSLNDQFKTLENPFQSPVAPDTNTFTVNVASESVTQWNGSINVAIDAYIHPTAPNIISVGSYWYDGSVLNKWNGASWDINEFISFSTDPMFVKFGDKWINGTNAYEWSGTVWDTKTLYTTTDPSVEVIVDCGSYWNNDGLFSKWNGSACTGVSGPSWIMVNVVESATDPILATNDDYWYDTINNVLNKRVGSAWNVVVSTFGNEAPVLVSTDNALYVSTNEQQLYQYSTQTNSWSPITSIMWHKDPTINESGDLWFDGTALFSYDVLILGWTMVTGLYEQTTDPISSIQLELTDLWLDGTQLKSWDGSGWLNVEHIALNQDPTNLPIDTVWLNLSNDTLYNWNGSGWPLLSVVTATIDPANPALNSTWYDTTTSSLYTWNGANWVPVLFTQTPISPLVDSKWLDTANNILYSWNGVEYEEAQSIVSVVLLPTGLKFISTGLKAVGSQSDIIINDELSTLFVGLSIEGSLTNPYYGSDPISGEPLYAQTGVGNDGSTDEREELIDSLRRQFGYPTVNVELDSYQMDLAVTAGLEELRKRTSVAYHRGFFFISVPPGVQSFVFNDKLVGLNKVVDVVAIHRAKFTLFGNRGRDVGGTTGEQGQASGGGYDVWSQLFYQNIQSGGQYDLVTYHALGQYLETLNQMFATDVTFNFNEHSRKLNIYNRINHNEVILVESIVERTENELLVDRFTKLFIEQWAYTEMCFMLAEIRGKFASLPGAGGGVSLNSADLFAKGSEMRAMLLAELDDNVIEQPEEFGMGTHFVLG